MAVKTNPRLLRILIICAVVWADNCLNNTISDCQCDEDRNRCYDWVTRKTCALMKGKLNEDKSCDCCPVCVIRRELFESCHQSIPGFKVFCADRLICSKKFGYVCVDVKQKMVLHQWYGQRRKKNPYEDRLISLVPEHQRPLKRVPRMQFKNRNK